MITLAHVTCYLATCPKSWSAYQALAAAITGELLFLSGCVAQRGEAVVGGVGHGPGAGACSGCQM